MKSSHLKREEKEATLFLLACMLSSDFLCEKVKYVNRKREKLVKASLLRVDHKLHPISVAQRDKKTLAIIRREIVAGEARYLRSCYRDYTRPQQKCHEKESVSSKANDAEYDAFADLFR